MKDSVRLRNFWRSVAAEQLGYAPKAQWIATEGAIEGREDTFRSAHLSRDPLLIVNDEAVIGQNIQRLDPPVMQAALHNEASINAQDMKDVTGIHDASLGARSNETSGKAINARQREGDIASLTYYDNGNASKSTTGPASSAPLVTTRRSNSLRLMTPMTPIVLTCLFLIMTWLLLQEPRIPPGV
jgi:hypothetical protein